MANLQVYTIGEVYVDGAKLTEAASLRIGRSSNSQAVLTISKGYAGESPGAAMTEVSVDSAVPSADFEFDPGKFMQDVKPVEFTFFAGGKTLTFKGFIITDNFSYAVNQEAKLEFTARGSFSNWQ